MVYSAHSWEVLAMKFRSSVVFILAYLMIAGFVSTAANSKGKPALPSKKISDISWGRFVTWPAYIAQSGANEFYEEDLFTRVYADHIRRSHKDLLNIKDIPYWVWEDWVLYFGAAASSDVIENIPPFNDLITIDPSIVNAWSLEQNWVYKKFAVVREATTNVDIVATGNPECPYEGRPYTYSVSVNSLSPGTRIQTKNNLFYLKNDSHAFGYVSYISRDEINVVRGDFSDPDNPITVSSTDLGENWILLFDTMDESRRMYNVQIPVVISFSHHPVISCDTDYIKFDFVDKDPSEELTVFISLPYGVDIADNAAVPPSGWTSGLPVEVMTRCRLINRMSNNWPVGVDENYYFINLKGTTPERVAITNSFSFSYMGSNWGVLPSPYAVLPPVLALAKAKSIDVDIPATAIDTGIPTKIGPLLMVDLLDEDDAIEYEIPGAPKHDIHFVGTHEETAWKQRVNRMINASALTPDKYRLDPDGTMNADLLTAAGNRGEAASLSLTRDWTRSHYIDWMQQLIDGHMFNEGLGEWKYYEHSHSAPPAEGSWPAFWAFYGDPTSTAVPWDIDAFAGIALEFIYEYGLWSGKWDTLNYNWDNASICITQMLRPLEIFHDWAYMAGSLTIYGGAGSIMDMFNAQLEGYFAYAKMAEALGKGQEAEWGRYLAAKAQIPFIMRWASKDYIAQYYKTDPAGHYSIISGFGEVEPSGPLYDNYNQVYVLDDWADWTIAGERIHPLGFDVLKTLSGDYFKDILVQFDDEFNNNILSVTERVPAGFGENKLYGFFKWRDADPIRWAKGKIENSISLLYTDYTSNSISNIEGPSLDYWIYSYSDADWYEGTTGISSTSIASKISIYPMMPAIMEAYYVPVRVGSWAPAVLDTASYNWETGTLTAHLLRPANLPSDSPEPIVRLQVDSKPTEISGDVNISGDPYDPIWKVAEIPLASGLAEWSVTVAVAPPLEAEWENAPANPNLISDPGFEEKGMGTPLSPEPNIEMGWRLWPPYEELYDLQEVDPGNQCVRMNKIIEDVSGNPRLYQYLWAGPTNPDEGSHHVTLEFDYRFDPQTLNILGEYTLWVNITAHPKEFGGEDEYVRILNQVISCADTSCVEGWQHFSSGMLTVPSSNPVLIVNFHILESWENPAWTPDLTHSVCLDNVSVTCPELNMGVDGGVSLSSPRPILKAPLPVLSNFVSYPNPFNPSVNIGFQMGRCNHALLNIYDVSGRLVKTLVNKTLPAGQHSFVWDGKNNRGATAMSGIYFYRLIVADTEAKGKLILLR